MTHDNPRQRNRKSNNYIEGGMTERVMLEGLSNPLQYFVVWCQFVVDSMFSGIVLYCKIAIIKMLV